MRQVIDAADLDLVSVGGPSITDRRHLSESLARQRLDDLRTIPVSTDEDDLDDPAAHACDVVLLATAADLEADERHWLRDLAESGVQVLSLETHPASFAETVAEHGDGDVSQVLPRMRSCAGWRAAREAVEQFGRPELVQGFFAARPEEGSLAARMLDAADVLSHVLSPIIGVGASMAAVHGSVPERWTAMRGSIAAHFQVSDASTAAIACTNHATAWRRRVILVGEGGRIEISDRGFRWIDQNGDLVDDSASNTPAGPRLGGMVIASAIHDAVRTSRQTSAASSVVTPPADTVIRAALCEAMRLAARTGATEDPRSFIGLLRDD